MHIRLFESLGTAALLKVQQVGVVPKAPLDVVQALQACLACGPEVAGSSSSSTSRGSGHQQSDSSSNGIHSTGHNCSSANEASACPDTAETASMFTAIVSPQQPNLLQQQQQPGSAQGPGLITASLLLRRMAVLLEACCLQPEPAVLERGLLAMSATYAHLMELALHRSTSPAAATEATERAKAAVVAGITPHVLRLLLPAFLHALQWASQQQQQRQQASAAVAAGGMGRLLSQLLSSEYEAAFITMLHMVDIKGT
jgi:hypothetical protein